MPGTRGGAAKGGRASKRDPEEAGKRKQGKFLEKLYILETKAKLARSRYLEHTLSSQKGNQGHEARRWGDRETPARGEQENECPRPGLATYQCKGSKDPGRPSANSRRRGQGGGWRR